MSPKVIRVSICTLVLFVSLSMAGGFREREALPQSPDDIRERVIKLIKRLPKILLPGVFDDIPVPTKP